MRLAHLSLQGYRGFRDLELPFPEQGPTVLIGKNGAGKSTILDAIASFLEHFVVHASRPPSRRKRGASLLIQVAAEEVHRDAPEARVIALFSADERRLVGRAVHQFRGFDLDPL